MQSAFVEIGLERAAFLHIADIWEHRQNGHGEHQPIERILHEGQALLVQVIKDPIGTKGARLSTQVSLAGRLLVYLPQDSHIGISQRIEDEAERESLRGKLQTLLPEGYRRRLHHPHDGGSGDRARAADRHRLSHQAVARPDRALARGAGALLLYQDLNLAQRVLRDMTTDETSRVLVDSRETFVRHAGVRARLHAGADRPDRSTTAASVRCSTCTASRTRSKRRWGAASTSNPAAT